MQVGVAISFSDKVNFMLKLIRRGVLVKGLIYQDELIIVSMCPLNTKATNFKKQTWLDMKDEMNTTQS